MTGTDNGLPWACERRRAVGSSAKKKEVAALLAFPAAAEFGFVTGQVYAVGGGRMAKLSWP